MLKKNFITKRPRSARARGLSTRTRRGARASAPAGTRGRSTAPTRRPACRRATRPPCHCALHTPCAAPSACRTSSGAARALWAWPRPPASRRRRRGTAITIPQASQCPSAAAELHGAVRDDEVRLGRGWGLQHGRYTVTADFEAALVEVARPIMYPPLSIDTVDAELKDAPALYEASLVHTY